jgi:pteridine reductase
MNAVAPVALITGGARRIGAAIARALHAAGYDIALHYRNTAGEAQALVAELLRQRSDSAFSVQAELADMDALPALVESVIARFGRLDAVINNASSFYPTAVGATTPAHWDELFASNAKGPYFLSQAAAPHLRRQRGTILNLVDLYASSPLAGHPVYCMAKAALAMMTRSLALELAPEVRVNAIAPGAILWPERGKSATARQALIDATPLARAGNAADIAQAAVFLLRDAPFVTGQILAIDGGRSI